VHQAQCKQHCVCKPRLCLDLCVYKLRLRFILCVLQPWLCIGFVHRPNCCNQFIQCLTLILTVPRLVFKFAHVSLFTSFSKIFEMVVQRRILKHLTKCNILSTEQFGFRLGLRTDNTTYKLTTEILNAMNNNLIAVGNFCDLEKAFDCVNHDILLSKLKFYGISDKDLQLYHSYLGNRYCRIATYKDSENSNKVSNWAKVRHGVPQGSILGSLVFLLYICDLPKIINKTSAPIIFADDTSILLADSNLTDLNKHICIVFTTLNKWLRADQLSLDFNKTNNVHFTTNKNMSVNVKIGSYNNFITNSSYTKFLGLTMNVLE